MSQSDVAGDRENMNLDELCETVLPFRCSKYIQEFREKLRDEGINAATDLLLTDKDLLETKLQTHAKFDFIQISDAISLRNRIANDTLATKAARFHKCSRTKRGRPRRRDKGYGRSRGGGRGVRRGINKSRSRRGIKWHSDKFQSIGERKEKPKLWAAVERKDKTAVQRLLDEGVDIDESFQGWTPLMKAAEEGDADVMQMLLDNNANIDACNGKGRSVLSFAAAPSRGRHTPIATLRLLLDNGANTELKDEKLKTAKDHAWIEKREDALSIFEEYRR